MIQNISYYPTDKIQLDKDSFPYSDELLLQTISILSDNLTNKIVLVIDESELYCTVQLCVTSQEYIPNITNKSTHYIDLIRVSKESYFDELDSIKKETYRIKRFLRKHLSDKYLVTSYLYW